MTEEPVKSTPPAPDPERSFFLHALFQKRLPEDQHIRLPLLARLLSLRHMLRLSLVAWYLLAIGLAGWLGFTYVQNVRVLKSGPIPSSRQLAEAGLESPLPELKKLHDQILDVEAKNRTLIISRFGFDASKTYERELKGRYNDLFAASLLRLESLALGYWRQNFKRFDARQKQLYAQFLLGQWQLHSGRIKNDSNQLKEYATLTAPLWMQLFNTSAEIPIAPLYLAHQRWHDGTAPPSLAPSYAQAMAELLAASRTQEAQWLWAAPRITAPSVAIEDFWIDFPQPGWITVPGGLTRQGRTQVETFFKQLLQPLEKKEAAQVSELFWENYWQQFFTAWERFTSELLEQGRLLSESPGNIVAAGPVLRQDGPYWRLFVRFAREMEGLPDKQNRPAWVRQWQILSAAWDSFILTQNRKTGGVADKLGALADRVVQSGEQLAGERINLQVSTRDQLADLFASYLADLAALSPVTVSREQRVDEFGKFFRGLQQGESSSFYTAYAGFRKLVTLDSAGADDTLASRLLFAPLAFITQVAAGEAATTLQQNWTETVIAPLGGGSTESQLTRLFSQADSPVPKFIAGPAAPFLEASASGYRPRRSHDMSLPFRPDFLAFLFEGTRAGKNTLKQFTVTLAARPMNVNPEATVRPYASKLSLQCAGKEYVLENWNYPAQGDFTWSPAGCGDVLLTVQFPAGISLSKRYSGQLGFPRFLDDFSDGRQTFNLNDFSGDSAPLAEQRLTSLTLAYTVTGAPDVRSWLHSVPPTIPEELFNKPQPQTYMPLGLDAAAEADRGASATSDLIFRLPASLLANYRLALAPPPAVEDRKPAAPAAAVNEEWIRRQAPRSFTLQLMSLRSSQHLDALRARHPGLELHWYRAGGGWHVLIAGAYSTRQEAGQALRLLPAELTRSTPLVKTFAAVQAEIQPSPARGEQAPNR